MAKSNKVDAQAAEGTETKTGGRQNGILTGRIPVPFVYLVRFNEDSEQTDSDLAVKYCTTPGKINDIRRGAGFPYVTKELVITQEDINEARRQVSEKLQSNDRGLTSENVEYMLSKLSEITVGETSNIEEMRAAHRKPRGQRKPVEKAEEVIVAGEQGEAAATDVEDLNDLVD